MNLSKRVLMSAVMFSFIAGVFAAEAGKAEVKPSGHKLDWYNWADVKTNPSIEGLKVLSDSDLSGQAKWGGGTERGGDIIFKFPKPVFVTMLRFQQVASLATDYTLKADTTGDNVYNKKIKTIKEKKAIHKAWVDISVNEKVYGLKLIAAKGRHGYRRPFPGYSEIEIYTKNKIKVTPVKLEKASNQLTLGKSEAYPKVTKKELEFILSADVWMAGLVRDGRNFPKDGDVTKLKGFQNFIEKMKEIDATGIRIFLEGNCCDSKMPWKSKICPDIGKDMLKGYIDGLHKNGLTATVMLHAWIKPILKGKQLPMPWRRWTYPYEQSERLLDDYSNYYKVKYPCVMSENDFRDKWYGIMAEIVDNGADGIYLQPDEYFYKGHTLSKLDKFGGCKSCEKAFKKMFGYDKLPKKIKDTEAYRKWKLYEYRQITKLFEDISKKLKKKKPNLQIISCDNQASIELHNQRLEENGPMDIYGKDPNIDLAQVYAGGNKLPFGAKTAFMKRFEAAFGSKKLLGSVQWLDIKSRPINYPLPLYGNVLNQVMNGAEGVEHYRYSYMKDTGWWPNALKTRKMMLLLENWGITKSYSPKEVCLLISRAGEDWWRVKIQGMMKDTNKKGFMLLYSNREEVAKLEKSDKERLLAFEQFRGAYSNVSMEGLLIENAIPFSTKYTDRLDTLDDLNQFKLMILPFGYSMSKASFTKIKVAVDKGTKLLIFNQLAPTDEIGNKYKEPLLKQLIGHKNVVFIDENLAAEGMRIKIRMKNIAEIKKLLGNDGYYFNNNDKMVEYIVREITPKSYILYVANWDKNKEASPIIGLPLPKGKYKLTVCSSLKEELNKGMINGKASVSAEGLKKFNIKLAPGELKLIKINKN